MRTSSRRVFRKALSDCTFADDAKEIKLLPLAYRPRCDQDKLGGLSQRQRSTLDEVLVAPVAEALASFRDGLLAVAAAKDSRVMFSATL